MNIILKTILSLFAVRLTLALKDYEAERVEKQKWYDYNSMFIHYGYLMHGHGELNEFERINNMLVPLSIDDFMKGRGAFFHPSVYWGPSHKERDPTIKFMFSQANPPNETLFEYARKEIELGTCIKFEQIEETPEMNCHAKGRIEYVCVYGEEGTCSAEYGQNLTKPTLFSVSSGCNRRKVLHEMGHLLGLQNAQARQDRDDFVGISFKHIGFTHDDSYRKAILSEHQTCANLSHELLGMPYDYSSIMHTGIMDYSANSELVLVPKNPKHLYMIDFIQDFFPHLSHYDLLAINSIYGCDKIYAKKCGSKTCENLGYLTKECKCACPKGTSGETCSSKSSSTEIWQVRETPPCYRLVDSDDDSFTLNDAGLVPSRMTPYTTHCVVEVHASQCRLPMITIDAREAMVFLQPKIMWWFDNNKLSCSYFNIFYNVTGIHTRNICWDQLVVNPVYWIFSRKTRIWLFARFRDQELIKVAGNIKLFFHTTGDYRCSLGDNDIFDAVNAGRMRSVGGTAESAKAMAIILPAVVVCVLIIIGFVYWKFIRVPQQELGGDGDVAEPTPDQIEAADDTPPE